MVVQIFTDEAQKAKILINEEESDMDLWTPFILLLNFTSFIPSFITAGSGARLSETSPKTHIYIYPPARA